jgi:guanylate kinase
MPEKTSKTKMNPDGSYKVYNSHLDPKGTMCFGVGEAPKESKKEWVRENIDQTKEMIADVKAEQEMKEDLEAEEPMSDEQKMWRAKEDRAAEREKEKGEQITRLTLAKSYIQATLTYDAAMQDGDLDKWTHWVLTGETLK